nr:hypothetical protein [Candidatus Sigynarchaeota archaeon]
MDKVKLMVLLPSILGVLGIALPANIRITGDGFVLFWMIGFFVDEERAEFLNIGKFPYLSLFLVSGIVLAAGEVLFFLAARGTLKLGKMTWLPGTVMVAGMALYMIMAGPVTQGEILLYAPIPAGLACGMLGAIWTLYAEIKAIRQVK